MEGVARAKAASPPRPVYAVQCCTGLRNESTGMQNVVPSFSGLIPSSPSCSDDNTASQHPT
jgi:hypothetical protein